MADNRQRVFAVVAIVLEAFILILFGIFVNYNDGFDEDGNRTGSVVETTGKQRKGHDPENNIDIFYPEFQDIHVMMFIGFGFLMTFLKRYSYSAVGVNFVLGAFILQWATLVNGFFELAPDDFEGKLVVDVTKLIGADFAAAAVMITFGAILGKVSPTQMLIVGFLEVIFYGINVMVAVSYLKIVDIGGSMLIHSFGAYFGLAVASVIDKRKAREPGSVKEGSSYHSDVFAMIGTIFLWMFWPSFNGGLAEGSIRHRTIINTYYSLSACVVSTFIFSSFFDDKRRFNMTHVQNAALAGGVAIGNVADLMIQPWGAILIGFIAGFISVLGYVKIQPIITNRLKLHDTCGVHNLHGMPGVFGAIAGIVAIAVLSDDDYGENLYSIFAARSPDEEDRSREEQAGYQIAALLVTLVIAIVGGMITGFIANISLFDPVLDEEDDLFEDDRLWEVSDELSFNLEDRIREIVRNRSNSFHLDYKQTQSSV